MALVSSTYLLRKGPLIITSRYIMYTRLTQIENAALYLVQFNLGLYLSASF